VSEQAIRQVLRSELERQAESGWSQLALVPSTTTWRAVAYLRELSAERLARLFDVLESAGMGFFSEAASADLMADPHYRQLVNAMLGLNDWDWAYTNVRTLRTILGAYRSKVPRIAAEVASTPPEVIERAEQIVPIKAADLRKLVKSAVAARFGAKPDNSGGGDWLYRGKCGSLEFTLSIDYGGYDQLRYTVAFTDAATGIRGKRLNYERLMGCGGTGWDYLTAHNAGPSIDLMCTFVETLAGIPERASSLGGPTKR
jgi:hypothetical protein